MFTHTSYRMLLLQFCLCTVVATSCSCVFGICVGHKAWICAIPGLCYAKCGSALCTTIHGLSTQSEGCANYSAQSTDLQAIRELARTYCGSTYSCHYRYS